MARKPINYWEERSTELMKRLEKGTENTINSLIQAYEQATKNINKEIENIFKSYAKDTGLDKKTLTQMLNKRESEQYYKNLLEVINNNITDESIKKKLLAKYNAPAYSYRISRYQVLQDNIDVELKKLANIEQDITKIRYVDTIKEGYYHNIYDIQKGTGLGFSFAQIDNRTINLILNENWVDNTNFSQRIWNNSEKLGNYLKTQLTADSMSGKSIAKISKELSEYMNVGLYNATTLVRTEVNHFANESEMLAYEELDIDKYRFIATLDQVTCKHCAELDNKVFNVKDRKPGKNYPPIHPNDRCTTVAEFDNDVIEGLQRRARDENGNTIYVDSKMNYKEWKEKYVTNVENYDILKANSKKSDIYSSKITKLEKIKDLSDRSKIQTLEKYENQIVNKKVENAVIIDKEGQIYLLEGNSSNSIYIKNVEDKLKGSYMTHNHPKTQTNYSFSDYDIGEFMETGMQKLRGIDYKYIYEIERTKDTIKIDRDRILNEFSSEFRYRALDIIRKQNLNADEEEYHIINQLLAQKYKYNYRRINYD